MSAMTVVSRVLGLARDVVTARIFGDTAVGSAFAAAFAIPNTFRRLFGEGALSAAFIPEYARLSDRDPPGADAFASLTVALLALATGALTVLIEVALLAVLVLAPDDPDRTLSLRLIMVTLPFMPLVCVAAILGGILQSHARFGPWAAAPILLNLCVIAAALAIELTDRPDPRRWAYVIGAAVVVAGALQVAWSLVALRGHLRWSAAWSGQRDRARRMLRRMLPVLLGLGTLQLNSLLDTLIAMWPSWVGPTILGVDYPLDTSSNAILFYAQRLYQFPLGVFGIAVATAAFPALSRLAHDRRHFADVLARGVRLSLFIALPASVGLLLVREDLVNALYAGQTGFSDEGVRRAGAVVVGYSVAIWAYALNQLLTRAFYATGDTATPMRIAVAMVGLNVLLNLLLIWPLGEAGLAWSTGIAAVIQCGLLTALARARLTRAPILDADAWRSVGRTGIAVAAMTAVLLATAALWTRGPAWDDRVARLAVMTALGAGVFGIGARALGAPELAWLLRRRVDR